MSLLWWGRNQSWCGRPRGTNLTSTQFWNQTSGEGLVGQEYTSKPGWMDGWMDDEWMGGWTGQRVPSMTATLYYCRCVLCANWVSGWTADWQVAWCFRCFHTGHTRHLNRLRPFRRLQQPQLLDFIYSICQSIWIIDCRGFKRCSTSKKA